MRAHTLALTDTDRHTHIQHRTYCSANYMIVTTNRPTACARLYKALYTLSSSQRTRSVLPSTAASSVR